MSCGIESLHNNPNNGDIMRKCEGGRKSVKSAKHSKDISALEPWRGGREEECKDVACHSSKGNVFPAVSNERQNAERDGRLGGREGEREAARTLVLSGVCRERQPPLSSSSLSLSQRVGSTLFFAFSYLLFLFSQVSGCVCEGDGQRICMQNAANK